MDTIRFSANWNNKLAGNAFTTLRVHNPSRYVVGNQYIIDLNGKRMGVALLKEKRTITIAQLNDFICYLDTGVNKQETIKILRNIYHGIDFTDTKLDFCLFVYGSKQTTMRKPTSKQYQIRMPYKD